MNCAAFSGRAVAWFARIVDAGLEAWREIQEFYRERGVTVGGPFDDE